MIYKDSKLIDNIFLYQFDLVKDQIVTVRIINLND